MKYAVNILCLIASSLMDHEYYMEILHEISEKIRMWVDTYVSVSDKHRKQEFRFFLEFAPSSSNKKKFKNRLSFLLKSCLLFFGVMSIRSGSVATGSRCSNRYRTKSKQSEVDEILFGLKTKKPAVLKSSKPETVQGKNRDYHNFFSFKIKRMRKFHSEIDPYQTCEN
jgi:hypothetical protein